MNPNETVDNAAPELTQEEQPTERCLLTIWSSVLGEPVDAELEAGITIGVAAKVVASWPFLSFADTEQYHKVYHSIIQDLATVVDLAIIGNPDATVWVGEDDGRENHDIYKNILVEWYLALDAREKEWKPTDENAGVLVAAIADARAYFFSSMGLAGHLDVIGFKMTNEEFLEAIQEAQEEVQGE